MKKIFLSVAAAVFSFGGFAQNRDKGTFKEYQPGYYQNTILKGIDETKKEQNPKEKKKAFKVDFSGMSLPTNPDDYTKVWFNSPISQGQTGTCWCFSTTSFYESEVYRITGQKVKLSEMFVVYWEYVERAKYFVEHRGKMSFGEGSETNALAQIFKTYGEVPEDAYNGNGQKLPFPDHSDMYNELDNYLKSVKERNAWNEDEIVATTKDILNHYLGVPPTTLAVNGKSMTPKDYLDKVLKIKPDDYVNFMSLMSEPFYTQAEYKVGDNWWHSKDYYNVPVNDFMDGIKTAIKNGYSISIGGDVSEAGLDATAQVGVIPTFDIPADYIDDNARQFRFSNGTTTDDHAMHLVGYYIDKDGKTWFLVKDSGSGSRNCGETCKSFGFFFLSEDYVKLKMMTTTVHKDAVKDLLKKMKQS
jgi:bleomycin hydrolase